MPGPHFGWLTIFRLGLVQAALGAIVVLTTSTLNRVMVVELALPALLPGLLVAIHYLVQMARPRMGYGSDIGQRRTPWIVGGLCVLACGGVLAALAVVLMASQRLPGIVLAIVAFVLIGIGVSASGTSLLVLLAKRVAPGRRSAAATIVWVMMIAGFAVTAAIAGKLLDPYSGTRLILVTAAVSLSALSIACIAIWRVEGHHALSPTPAPEEHGFETRAPQALDRSDSLSTQPPSRATFKEALGQVWDEPVARRFTIFVFVSMLAYSAQDLILEPFAGSAFGFTPGESTGLSGIQHGGVLLGMLAAALAGRGPAGNRFGSLRAWQIGGCLMSALMLLGLAAAGFIGPGWPLEANVFALGVANGSFSIAAIASMMRLAGEGRHGREGVRMGLWGAAQAVAFGMGGIVGTAASDLARWLVADTGMAYASVFAFEAVLFVAAATLTTGMSRPVASRTMHPVGLPATLDRRWESQRAR